MQKELWIKVNRLAKQALDLPKEGREAFLSHACAGAPSLLKETRVMLKSIEKVDNFMETPVLSKLEMILDGENPALSMPEKIGNWQILSKLGEGGMGIVYLANQLRPFKRQVALKVIKGGYLSKEILARFSSEHQALAYMDHPFIARIFESGITEAGAPYFTMEYLPGLPLTDYCRLHRLPLAERLQLFRRVCEGVQHAHQRGIIHCDLKPSNIIVVDQDGVAHPKLIDFGIARAIGGGSLTDRTLITRQMSGLGTPAYMSPEQANHRTAEIDTRTDIYALGAILYELLCGVPPCDVDSMRSASLTEKLRIICEKEILPPSIRLLRCQGKPVAEHPSITTPKMLRGDLDWIVMKALEKDRSRRYDSAAEFGRDTERYLRNEPVAASPPSKIYKLKKFGIRNRTWIAASLVAFTAVLLCAILLTASRVRARSAQILVKKYEDFLIRTLSAPHPEVDSRDVTVISVLDKAAEDIVREFKDYPQIRANVSLALGRTYFGLGSLQQAEQLLASAVALREQGLGLGHPDTLEAKEQLAILHYHQGHYAQAEVLLAEVRDGFQGLYGAEDRRTLRSRFFLAGVYKDSDRVEEAVIEFKEVLSLQTRILGEIHLDTAASMIGLGDAIYLQADYKGAETYYLKALAIQKRLLSNDHPRLLKTRLNLSNVLDQQSRYAEAESVVREILVGQQVALGENHPNTLQSMHSLSRLLCRQGRFGDGALLASETLGICRRTLGGEHELTQSVNELLALNYAELGCFEEARLILAEVAEYQISKTSRDHRDSIRVTSNLADVLKSLGRYDEAAAILWKNRRLLERRHGIANPLTFPSACTLAEVFMARGDLQEAEDLFAELAVYAAMQPNPANDNSLYIQAQYGRCLSLQQRFLEAQDILLACRQKAVARKSTKRDLIEDYLADLYEWWGAAGNIERDLEKA